MFERYERMCEAFWQEWYLNRPASILSSISLFFFFWMAVASFKFKFSVKLLEPRVSHLKRQRICAHVFAAIFGFFFPEYCTNSMHWRVFLLLLLLVFFVLFVWYFASLAEGFLCNLHPGPLLQRRSVPILLLTFGWAWRGRTKSTRSRSRAGRLWWKAGWRPKVRAE